MKLVPIMIAALLCAPMVAATSQTAMLMRRPAPMEGKAPETKVTEVVKSACIEVGASNTDTEAPYKWETGASGSTDKTCAQINHNRNSDECDTFKLEKDGQAAVTDDAKWVGKLAKEICSECGACTDPTTTSTAATTAPNAETESPTEP